ncbi:MAG: outer membrane lipoprotein-sorting protein [Gemmatimonadetes bacterium]|nr:outer membrane lipoprotein-sorting protein [Gemmatimonadota bacterium]
MSDFRRIALALLVGAVFVPAPPAAAQAAPDVAAVLDHLDDLYRASSSHAVMTMRVERARGTRELTLESWSRGMDDALIVIRAPAREEGTATLMTDDGLWNYAPRADRLIRIPSGLLSESWMGSHFTNDDLLRETSYREDYSAEADWVDEGDERALRITLTPRPEAPVVYTRVEFWLDERWVPSRTDYFDGDDLVRTMRYSDVAEVSGRLLPLTLTVIPTDTPSERTVVIYHTLELDVDVEGDLFTRRGLRRVARG